MADDEVRAAARNTLKVSGNGPLVLRGEIHIELPGADGPDVRAACALCRCGRSQTKPFCDTAHRTTGFDHDGSVAPRDVDSADAAVVEAGGPLTVRPQPNGPYVVSGPMTVLTASGEEAWQGVRAAFCRCGHSSTKPFCDGTHAKIGFEAP